MISSLLGGSTSVKEIFSPNLQSFSLFSSSSSVYGDSGILPTKESCSKNPISPYALQKSVIEEYCKLFYNLYGLENVCLRYFNVFGPRQAGSGPYANVVSSWCENGIKHKNIRLDGKGEASRDFVYVKDIVSANIHAFKNYESLSSKWYEVGSGESRKFEDVLDILDIDYSYLEENQIPKGYQFYTCSQKTKWMKGWKPKYDLEKGLKEYSDYL